MGYLDSRHLVNTYLRATKFDQRQLFNINVQMNKVKSQQTEQSNLLTFNHRANTQSLERYYSAQIKNIEAQLADANSKGDSDLVNQLKQQLEVIKQEQTLAASRLQAQFDETNNRMVDAKHQQDLWFELKKENWEEQKKQDDGLLAQAREMVKEALKNLYPQNNG